MISVVVLNHLLLIASGKTRPSQTTQTLGFDQALGIRLVSLRGRAEVNTHPLCDLRTELFKSTL
jgi:hypothetical protein